MESQKVDYLRAAKTLKYLSQNIDIIEDLPRTGLPVGVVMTKLGEKQSNTSRILIDGYNLGVLDRRRVGKEIYYMPEPSVLTRLKKLVNEINKICST